MSYTSFDNYGKTPTRFVKNANNLCFQIKLATITDTQMRSELVSQKKRRILFLHTNILFYVRAHDI